MAISQPQESIWAQEGHLTSTVAIGITNTPNTPSPDSKTVVSVGKLFAIQSAMRNGRNRSNNRELTGKEQER